MTAAPPLAVPIPAPDGVAPTDGRSADPGTDLVAELVARLTAPAPAAGALIPGALIPGARVAGDPAGSPFADVPADLPADVAELAAGRLPHPDAVLGVPDLGVSDLGVPVLDAGARGGGSLETLVRSAVAGDAGARERLLVEIHPFVLRYCRARLGRQDCVLGSADDVAQDVCLAVVGALPTYTMKGLSFRAFVYGIAAHKVTDAFRAIGRNRCESLAELPDRPVTDDGPEHRVLHAELTRRLTGLLHLLTPRQREVLVLRVAVGLSAEETAQAVRSTPGAVRVTQHRAITRLRELVDGTRPAFDLERADGVRSTG